MPTLTQLSPEDQERYRNEQDKLRKKAEARTHSGKKEEGRKRLAAQRQPEFEWIAEETRGREEEEALRLERGEAFPLEQEDPAISQFSLDDADATPKTTKQWFRLCGLQKKTVIADGATIRIVKQGRIFSARREKTLPIRNISSVEVKKPGAVTPGFIQFSIAGAHAHDSSYKLTGGSYDAMADENSVVFNDEKAYRTALKIKEYVETYRDSPPVTIQLTAQPTAPFSVADEILKLKLLLDQGIISEEEFQTKKRRLLEM